MATIFVARSNKWRECQEIVQWVALDVHNRYTKKNQNTQWKIASSVETYLEAGRKKMEREPKSRTFCFDFDPGKYNW